MSRGSIESRFWEKVVVTETGCWGWNGATHPSGYGLLGRGKRGEGLIRASHVSWQIHYGTIPKGMWILHICDNPKCCRPDHLFLGDVKTNNLDMRQKGRSKYFGHKIRFGSFNNNGKLTDEDVAMIRSEWQNAPLPGKGRVEFRNKIAARYGISDTHVKDIVANRTRTKPSYIEEK